MLFGIIGLVTELCGIKYVHVCMDIDQRMHINRYHALTTSDTI